MGISKVEKLEMVNIQKRFMVCILGALIFHGQPQKKIQLHKHG